MKFPAAFLPFSLLAADIADRGIVLTGGGAQISGAVEMAQSVFGTSSVRIGCPQSLGGMEDKYRIPEYATAVGLILAHKDHAQQEKKHGKKRESVESKRSGESGFQKFLKKFF